MKKTLAIIKIQRIFRGHLLRSDRKLVRLKQNRECSISFETMTYFNSTLTSCGHLFLKDSLYNWYNRSPSKECPICRYIEEQPNENLTDRRHFLTFEQQDFLIELLDFQTNELNNRYQNYAFRILTEGLGNRSGEEIYSIINQNEVRLLFPDLCDVFDDAWSRRHTQVQSNHRCCILS